MQKIKPTVFTKTKDVVRDIAHKHKIKNFIFYTAEGSTFQPESLAVYPDTENLQILGWAKGGSPREALETLRSENDWLSDSKFNEVIAAELKNDKSYYFNLRDSEIVHSHV